VPVTATAWGLPGALSVRVRVAVRLPTVVGVNVTLMVQLLLAATEPLHVLLCAKSPGLVPVSPTLLKFKEAFPLLLTVTVCAELVVPTVWLVANIMLAGLRFAVGPVPAPLRVTACWLPDALLVLSVIVKDAVRDPEAVGVNVTLMVQLVLVASELPHVVL